ncbi:hypothetical protein AB0L40_16215 [Patulibacter sp. NPDC049589]|uniref:hypothetical protein n=1 Tax=Patulibacter sp. NPDC049589 TaxID=3154731 RepID=UPI003428C277
MTHLMYVRILADRPVGLVPGSYVVGEERPGATPVEVNRATGLPKTVGSADVLIVRDVPKAREPDEPSTTEATLLRASQPLPAREAEDALRGWRSSQHDRDAWRNAALQVVNTAVRALRITMRDPYAVELTDADLLGTAFGHVSPADAFKGADGTCFREGPAAIRKPSRSELLRRGEAVGLALRGAVAMLEGEELVALAAREANHGRLRSAAAALRAGRELLDAELLGAHDLPAGPSPGGRSAVGGIDPEVLIEEIAVLQDAMDRWRVTLPEPVEEPPLRVSPGP